MKDYLKHLRWLLWVSALLPFIRAVSWAYPQFTIIGFGVPFLVTASLAYATLFFLAGRKAAQCGYAFSKAIFAGPVVLTVSHLIVGVPLVYLRLGPYLPPGKLPAWTGWLLIPFGTILGYLILFPIALGCAALGVYFHRRGQMQRIPTKVSTVQNGAPLHFDG